MKQVPRVFHYASTVLADPDPSKSPQEVKEIYSTQYENLRAGTVTGPEIKGTENPEAHYTFKPSIGTKG